MKLTKGAMKEVVEFMIIAKQYLKQHQIDMKNPDIEVFGYYHGVCTFANIFNLSRDKMWNYVAGSSTASVWSKMDVDLFISQFADKEAA